MRYWALFWSVIFTLFAAVQLNDPDPVIWTGFYLLTAAAHLMHFLKRYRAIAHVTLMSIAMLWSFIYIPEMIEWLGEHEFSDLARAMKAEESYIEGSREFLGLMIVSFSLLIPWYRKRNLKVT